MTDEVRDMIAKALDGEPPVRTDFDAVRAAGRRRLARRNLGIAGAAVLGVVAAVSTAVTVGHLNAEPANVPVVPPSPTASGPPPARPVLVLPSKPGCVLHGSQPDYGVSAASGVADAAAMTESVRLTDAFSSFRIAAPAGVTLENTPRFCVVGDVYAAEVAMLTSAAERTVVIVVRQRGGESPQPCPPAGGTGRCAVQQLPDGTAVRVSEMPSPGPKAPLVAEVSAWRPDGTVVLVREGAHHDSVPNVRFLGDEAMIGIATSPVLRVVPAAEPPAPPAPSEGRAAELTAALALAYPLPAGMRAERAADARAAAMTFVAGTDGYTLEADLVDAAGAGHISVTLTAPDTPRLSCDAARGCRPIVMRDGRLATLDVGAADGVVTVRASTFAWDGRTQVTVVASNRSSRAAQPGKTRENPPLAELGGMDLLALAELRW